MRHKRTRIGVPEAVFTVSAQLVEVVAVAHTKRRPGYWQNR